jgi:hypothetical protein
MSDVVDALFGGAVSPSGAAFACASTTVHPG